MGGATSSEPDPVPEHWIWRHGAVAPGDAVVFDIDGVLSDAANRQHYLESPRRDWEGFFDACGDDSVIEEVKALVDLLDPALRVVLLTGRPLRVHQLTEAWLRRYVIRWGLLVMRPWGGYAAARHFKRHAISELRQHGLVPRLAFEDDPRNAEMFRAEGVHCVYLHSGYYD